MKNNPVFWGLFCHFLQKRYTNLAFLKEFCKNWQNNPQNNMAFFFTSALSSFVVFIIKNYASFSHNCWLIQTYASLYFLHTFEKVTIFFYDFVKILCKSSLSVLFSKFELLIKTFFIFNPGVLLNFCKNTISTDLIWITNILKPETKPTMESGSRNWKQPFYLMDMRYENINVHEFNKWFPESFR